MKIKQFFSLQTQFQDKIARVTLTNPKKRNPLSIETIYTLNETLDSLENQYKKDKNPRVVVLSAEGPVFSAGHDLKQIQKQTQEQNTMLFEEFSKVCLKMRSLPFPIISKVEGVCAAAGLQLVLSSDIVVSGQNASYSCPGVKLGLFCSTPGVALYESSKNEKKSLELLLTGDSISPQQALDMGIINYICQTSEIDEQINQISQKIIHNSPDVIEYGKHYFYKMTQKKDLEQKYNLACQTMTNNLNLADCREGLNSFIEKRKPEWNKQ